VAWEKAPSVGAAPLNNLTKPCLTNSSPNPTTRPGQLLNCSTATRRLGQLVNCSTVQTLQQDLVNCSTAKLLQQDLVNWSTAQLLNCSARARAAQLLTQQERTQVTFCSVCQGTAALYCANAKGRVQLCTVQMQITCCCCYCYCCCY
jgi:hypothetical protein